MKRTKGKIKQEKPISSMNKQVSGNIMLALIIGVIVFIINYSFLIPDEYTLSILSYSKISFVSISLVLSIFVSYNIYQIEKKATEKISKYSFLIFLLYSILLGIIFKKENSDEFILLNQQIIIFQSILLVPAATLGIISIWINKIKLRRIINSLFAEQEILSESFNIKNRILKPITNLFSKKERLPTLGFFFVIIISIFTLFYRLDYFDLYSDEGTTTQGAAGYYHSGEFKFWDFTKDELIDIEYRRAIPHQFLVALSYKIFGISTWSSRLPSVILTLIFIIFGYFFSRYFIRDSFAALLIVFSFSLYFEFLFLQRWGRMYAMIFPLFLFLYYLSYKFLTEPYSSKLKNKESSFFSKYFNFRYILLPFLLIFLFLTLKLHVNITILLPILFLFIITSTLIYREKKYIPLIILGIIVIISQVIYPILFNFKTFTFFEAGHSKIYSRFFFGYPFSEETNAIILIVGIAILIISKNKLFTKKYLLLFVSAFFSWLFFALIVDFPASFRYISFLVPLVIILIIGLFTVILKTLFNKYIQIFFVLLLLTSVVTQFNARYDDLYVKNFISPAKPSVAWKTIIDNYEPGEIIYKHWGPMLYFDDIDSDAIIKTIGSGKKQKLPLSVLVDTLNNYKSGWLTWNTQDAYIIYQDVKDYCNIYFDKKTGYGLDSLGVEIFHYSDSMLVDTIQFQSERFLPNANLNLKHDFSVAFSLKINNNTAGSPFIIRGKNKTQLLIDINSNSLLIKYIAQKRTEIGNFKLSPDNLHHIVLYQKSDNAGQKAGLFINGKLIKERTLNSLISDIVKFKINTKFTGQINDIRIYDFALDAMQIQEILKNTEIANTEELQSEGVKFRTLYHWQKR